MEAPFIKQNRGEQVDEIIIKYPFAFILITIIARRARREESKVLGLGIGECWIGDYENYGMSERQYRTAKSKLEEWGFCSFKPTNKGTTALLLSDAVYCINATDTSTSKRRASDEQATTNKNDKKERKKEDITQPLDFNSQFQEYFKTTSNITTEIAKFFLRIGWEPNETPEKFREWVIRTSETYNLESYYREAMLKMETWCEKSKREIKNHKLTFLTFLKDYKYGNK